MLLALGVGSCGFLVGRMGHRGPPSDLDLMDAVKRGDAEEVRDLLERGANPDPPFVNAPPIYTAAEHGYDEVVEALVEHGADCNAPDGFGESPLNMAILGTWRGDVQRQYRIAELLIKHGANVHGRDHIGETPLHVAATMDQPELANLLLQHGALINAQDNWGSTPLDIAYANGHTKVTAFLRSQGGVSMSPLDY